MVINLKGDFHRFLYKAMKVFYTDHAGSEYDYVLYDILSNVEKEVELFNKTNMLSLLKRTEIIKNNIFVSP